MKKSATLLCLLLITFFAFSQSKPGEVNLNNIKRFYDRLSKNKIDTKDELVWRYTYSDTSKETLVKLSKVLEKENLKPEEIIPSKKSTKKYCLTLSEKKIYKKPEKLNERVEYLNSIAAIFKITDEQAVIEAERPSKEYQVEDYQKVGKQKKENE